jgi:hypothetical protein
LEAAAAQILVAAPVVRRLEEQPMIIWYAWEANGCIELLTGSPLQKPRLPQRASYIVPDFMVQYYNGAQHLIEVKPSTKLPRLDVQRKLSVARKFAEGQGWSFHVVTERELWKGSLLNNVRLLNRFRCVSVPMEVTRHAQELVAGQPRILRDLAHKLSEYSPIAIKKTWLLHMAVSGQLDIDPRDAPISDATLFYPRGTIPWDPFDSVWGPSGSLTVGPSGSSASSAPTISSPKT